MLMPALNCDAKVRLTHCAKARDMISVKCVKMVLLKSSASICFSSTVFTTFVVHVLNVDLVKHEAFVNRVTDIVMP